MNKTNFGAAMRRPLPFLFLLLVVAMFALLPGVSQAEVLQVTDFFAEFKGKPIVYSYIDSLLVDGDTIHLLTRISTDETRPAEESCCVFTSEGKLVLCPYNCARQPSFATYSMFVHLVTPAGFTYGISEDGKIYRWTPGAEEPWQFLSENPIIAELRENIHRPFPGYVASDNAIYEVHQDEGTLDWYVA